MSPLTSSVPSHRNSLPVLYAHRGSMLLAPENTLQAFELALRHGADVLEIDVRISRDDEVIVIHDERVDRTCDGHGRVRDMNFVQLKNLNAGYHFTDLDGHSHRQQNARLLSLAELFELMPDTTINIDIKDNSEQAAAAVARVIDEAERHRSVNVGSFHSSALVCFRKLQPHTTTSATQAEVAKLYFQRGRYQNLPFEYLQIPMSYMGIPLATKGFIHHANQRGLQTVYWTINDRQTMQRLINLGATGIVTDRVDTAGALLGKHC